ncbi:ABC-2 type transport system permease protein [Marininema mesophilum]|uniref:ABC-2 type transport system permease protein n=1 Tax=Marininema mesophilum TaxID=1048340 RepID=A0A1H3AUP8_9BACL|nr:ABC transporter permease [Marininema mesophilum]SDX33325.1 ABC-2 type transport system permease protein [Marininema mesophilum]
MRAYWQLTWAQLLLFARNKNMIIWSFFLPIFMMLALGTFMGKGGNQFSMSVAIEDKDHSTYSKQLTTMIDEKAGVKVKRIPKQEALKAVEKGDVSIFVRFDKGLGDRLEKGKAYPKGEKESIRLYFDKSNPTVSQIGTTVINQAVDQLNKKAINYHPAVKVAEKDIQSRPLRTIDFLVPGILSLMIMSNNLNGVAATIASWRERGILRRMQGTPLKSSTFIAGQITARVLLNSLQAVAVLLVAYFVYDVKIYGSWLLLLMIILLGTLTFMSIGFIIASLSRTPETAGPIAGLISFPMIFVGGIFFPVRDLPGLLQPVVKAIPIGYLTDGLRGVMNEGATLTQLWLPTTVLTAWFAVAFAIAAMTFRWDVK